VPANKPPPREIENCRPFLEAEIRLLRDLVVVATLGHVAHSAWQRVRSQPRNSSA